MIKFQRIFFCKTCENRCLCISSFLLISKTMLLGTSFFNAFLLFYDFSWLRYILVIRNEEKLSLVITKATSLSLSNCFYFSCKFEQVLIWMNSFKYLLSNWCASYNFSIFFFYSLVFGINWLSLKALPL